MDVENEIIDIDDDDSDRLRQNIYEDFDELADLAVTSCEPAPPGTTTLQEDLLSLITENTVPGVMINKDEVVSWLKKEDALLTGSMPYPSPPDSGEKYNSASESLISSNSWSPSEKGIPSAAVKKSERRKSVSRRSSDRRSRDRRSSNHRSRHRPRSSHNHRDRRTHHERRIRRPDCTSQSRHQRGWKSERENRISGVGRRTQFQRHIAYNNRNNSRYNHTSISPARRVTPTGRVFGMRDARELLSKQPSSMEQDIKHLEEQIKSSELGARRMVREAQYAKRHLEEYLSLAIQREREELRCIRQIQDKDKRRQKRDHSKSPERTHERHKPRTVRRHYTEVKSHSSERERSEEKKTTREKRHSHEKRQGSEKRHTNERRRSSEKRQSSVKRHSSNEKRHSSNEKRHNSNEKRHNSNEKRHSPEDSDTENTCDKSHKREKRHSSGDKPEVWKILHPSEVDGFNCTGPAIFVQQFGRDVRRKVLFSHFKTFGSVVDIQLLHLGRNRIRSACVIYSRQSEADRAIQSRVTQSSNNSRQSSKTIDNLLSALTQPV